jgi:hypothetical protein
MKRIYVSTVGRGKQKEESSKIYCIDVHTGKILAQVKLPLSMLDLAQQNGGCRGARGITFVEYASSKKDTVIAAGFDGLFEMDPDDLFINRGTWFRNMRDIHQIYCNSVNQIETTGTFTNEVFISQPEHFASFDVKEDFSEVHPGSPAPDWFPGCRDTLHLNALSENYALCNKAHVIIDRRTKQVALEDEELLGSCHDIWELPTGEIAINDSGRSRTITLDPTTWKLERVLFQETETEGGSWFAKKG